MSEHGSVESTLSVCTSARMKGAPAGKLWWWWERDQRRGVERSERALGRW